MPCVLTVDVGSTFTKGALLALDASAGQAAFRVLSRASTPTTVDHLARGFQEVCERLKAAGPGGEVPVYFSSSAKGGLAIAALGIVPELTLKSARLTALSAGGRVTSVHAYKLSSRDLQELERQQPDILLLAGGTDGGNETYVRHNARVLSACEGLRERTTVVYAGNQVLTDEVVDLFTQAGFDVRPAPNILPEMDCVCPEGARERIREVFLQRIVKGKGLDEIVARTGRAPNPTPYAVLQLVEAISRQAPEFGEFLLVDMGGATTDVYSCCRDQRGAERVVYRGLPEPRIKRTVEGDLGMRVSAASAARAAEPDLEPEEADVLAEYVGQLTQNPGLLASTPIQQECDRWLAGACLKQALLRHAGTHRRVFTAAGETFVQTGKDLRSVSRVIGSGGYLSQDAGFEPGRALRGVAGDQAETLPLVPQNFDYLRDEGYLLPLLGNLVCDYEEPAVRTALSCLVATSTTA